MKERVKGYCAESKCEYDTYTAEKIDSMISGEGTYSKAEIDQKIEELTSVISAFENKYQLKITSGTEEPTGGNDGDIYIKY